MQKPISLCALFLTLWTSHTAAATRLAIPTAEEQTKLCQELRHQFAEQFASPERADQLALYKTLWKSAAESTTPSEQFAMLCEARDAAARAGELVLAQRVCDAITTKFVATPATVRAGMFAAAAEGVGTQLDQETYFTALTLAVDQALLADDFEPARKMIDIGTSTAANLQAPRWEQALANRQADFSSQLKAFTVLYPSIEKLRSDPSDVPSTLAVGQYECFIKGDWHTGLPLLDVADTEYLHKYARIELYEPMNETDQIRDGKMNGKLQMSIADNWDSLESTLPAEDGLQLHLHVFDWYMRALPRLPDNADDDREHIQNQLKKLLPAVESRRPDAAILITICDSLSRKTSKPSIIIGGSTATEPFNNIPENGGLLIGFHYSLAMLDGQKVITFLQPIYCTPAGEMKGPGFGHQYSKLQTLRAPFGYAIGALMISGGDCLNSITPAFMRVEKDRLNPADVIRSKRIGGNGGSEAIFNGYGTPIIGVCGKQRDGYLGLGLVFARDLK